MAARRVSMFDLEHLQKYIIEKALTCIHPPEGPLLRYRFVIPTYDAVAGADDKLAVAERSATGAYLQMYDWDSCSFAMDAWKLGVEGLPIDVVSNFLALQDATGYIPRTVSPGQVWDGEDLCKPFLSQTLLADMERTNWAEFARVELLLPALEKFLRYYLGNRRHECGLFFWRNVLESGVDDNYALLAPHEAAKDEDQTKVKYPDGRLLATDLNTYLVCEFRDFAVLAARAGNEALAQEFNDLAASVTEKIEGLLYDASLGLYVNVDPETNTAVRLRSWTGLVPVLFGIASPERTLRCIKVNILNPEHFLRPFGIASMAASEPLSNQSPRGLYGRAIVCNWNGPVWLLICLLAMRRLLILKMRKEARDVALRVLAAMVKDLKETGVLHENYDANTGKSLWAPQFMSWNLMALELIDLVKATSRPSRRRP